METSYDEKVSGTCKSEQLEGEREWEERKRKESSGSAGSPLPLLLSKHTDTHTSLCFYTSEGPIQHRINLFLPLIRGMTSKSKRLLLQKYLLRS